MPASSCQAVEELNRQTGAGIDPNGDPGAAAQTNTRGLMAAVSSLPELTERKRCIDKHTNLATHLLQARLDAILPVQGQRDADAVSRGLPDT